MAKGEKNYSDKHKHLGMIQAVINRMGSNSFVFKGWSITIIAGISAFAANDSNPKLILIPMIATLLFWSVDAYYLMLEREFRKLYQKTAAKVESEIDFLMSIEDTSPGNWFKTLWRPILAFFYGLILVILALLLAFVTNLNVSIVINYGA